MNGMLHRSIFFLEDEALLAMDMEMALSAAGFRVIGPAASNQDAFALLRTESPDLAILDLNLGKEMSFPVFDRLAELDKPFVIVSGHSRDFLPARFRNRPFLQKPYQIAALLRLVHETLAAADATSVFKSC